MFYIVKVTNTAGSSLNYLVLSKIEPQDIQQPLYEYLEKDFGQFCSIGYIEQIEVPDISIADKNIHRVLDFDSVQ